VGILESWLLAAAVVHEGALHRFGVVERYGVKEFGWLLRPIHVNAILHKIVNIEEPEFVDELPVSP